MTKEKQAKAGTLDELADMYPGTRTLTVRIVRVTGKGEARKVSYESRKATVYALSIQQLGRVGKALAPIAAGVEGDVEEGIFEAVAELIGFEVADVGAMHASDFRDLVAAILEMNTDFFIQPRANPASDGQATTAGTNGDGAMPSSSSSLAAATIPSGSH